MDTAAPVTEWERRFRPLSEEFQRLLERSGAATILLLDTSGACVLQSGREPAFDVSLFSSLAAGDYLATREIVDLLGERNPRWVMHQGEKRGLVIAPIEAPWLIAVVFDGRTSLGLVRHAMRKHWPKLQEALRPLAGQAPRGGLEEGEELTEEERKLLIEFAGRSGGDRLPDGLDQIFDSEY